MIFLDTSYINGLILKNDSYQEISNQLRYFLKNETKATNITVLVEVLNSINQNNFHMSENLCIALILFTYFFVLSYHAVISANYYYAHILNLRSVVTSC